MTMSSAAPTTPTDAHGRTEELEPHGILGHSARRDSLAFARPAPGRYLAVEDGEVTRLVALHQTVTHLGRGFSADLRLEDQSVSRRHAVVVDNGEGVRILDDRSANGTFVNGVRVTDCELHDRDVDPSRSCCSDFSHGHAAERRYAGAERRSDHDVWSPSHWEQSLHQIQGRRERCVGGGGWWQWCSSSRWG